MFKFCVQPLTAVVYVVKKVYNLWKEECINLLFEVQLALSLHELQLSES